MKRSVLILAVTLLLVSLVGYMAACGDDEEPAATTAAPTETTAAPTETTAAPAGDAKILRLATLWPVGDPVTNNIQEFVDNFNTQAKGEYKIEMHPAASLVSMGDSFDAVRTGNVEMVGFPIGVFGGLVPEFNLAELPFAINTMEADAEYNALMTPIYDKVLTEKHNMKDIFNFACQGLDLASVRPIRTLEDWNGFLCQTVSPATAKVVESLGGAGVAIDFNEGYQALQKKVVEGTLQSGSMFISFKVYEVAKELTKCYATPASIGVFINLDVYNKMPTHIQELVVRLGLEAQASTNANFIQIYHDNFVQMTELGMEVYPLPSAERDRWVEKLKPYAEELLAAVDQATADQVRQITQELDKKYPYTD